MKDLTLQKILQEFLDLANILDHLLYPSLLEAANEVDENPGEAFEVETLRISKQSLKISANLQLHLFESLKR